MKFLLPRTAVWVMSGFVFLAGLPSRAAAPSSELPDFKAMAATSDSIRKISKSDFRGHVWVADFIFTTCGGICPRMTRQMRRLHNRTDPEVLFATFTIDPKTDTLAVLQSLAKEMEADPKRWFFIRMSEDKLKTLMDASFSLVKSEKANFEKNPDDKLNHNSFFVVMTNAAASAATTTASAKKASTSPPRPSPSSKTKNNLPEFAAFPAIIRVVKIAFVHSGPELTGSWTYAKALAREWGERHEVFWIHDGMIGAEDPSLRLPIGKKLVPAGISNGQKLAAFVRQNNISILHSHSRRANMVAAIASRLTGVPYVTTAHLCMTPHLFNRLWPCFGNRAIAICENVQENLMAEHGVSGDSISLIRNGIDLELFRPQPAPAGPWRWITILGRLSGHRWRAGAFILSLIGDILPDYPDVRFRFIGSVEPSHQQELQEALDRLNAGFREPRVLAPGFIGDIKPLLVESTTVMAAGRSLMEAMAMERPVIAVGEEFALGLLTPRNIQQARESNFGDFRKGPDRSASDDKDPVVKDIRSILDKSVDVNRLGAWGREQVDLSYNIEKVAAAVEDVYTRLAVPAAR